MATTTPNFGWSVPTSSDLVKNGATAIETLGDSIDASLVDLKGGTTGQVLAKATDTDMDFTWTTAGGGGSSNVAGKNGVLNSAINVWQKGTSVAVSGSNYIYTADRWQLNSSSNDCTVTRQATNDTTNLPFIQYCARVQRNSGQTGLGNLWFYQPFETLNSLQYAGKTVTMSFYARKGANFSGASDVLNFRLYTGTGTDENFRSGTYTGSATPIDSTATLTTTWQRFSASATVASTATEVTPAIYYTPSGTAGANDYFEVTGVQLEIASAVSAYSPNQATYASELAACQRYFQQVINGNTQNIGAGWNYSSSYAMAILYAPVTMRVEPTIAVTSGTNYYTFERNGGTDSVNAFFGAANSNPNNTITLRNSTEISGTAGDAGLWFSNNASANISLSAEL